VRLEEAEYLRVLPRLRRSGQGGRGGNQRQDG